MADHTPGPWTTRDTRDHGTEVQAEHFDGRTIATVYPRGNWYLNGEGKVQNRDKTACPKGHAYDGANTVWRTSEVRAPYRVCLACQRSRQQAKRASKITERYGAVA